MDTLIIRASDDYVKDGSEVFNGPGISVVSVRPRQYNHVTCSTVAGSGEAEKLSAIKGGKHSESETGQISAVPSSQRNTTSAVTCTA